MDLLWEIETFYRPIFFKRSLYGPRYLNKDPLGLHSAIKSEMSHSHNLKYIGNTAWWLVYKSENITSSLRIAMDPFLLEIRIKRVK